MFYSQIVLAKKGPLGQLWMAAHFQDRKLSRAQIFATDISESVENIVHPAMPLALRVSGHLLLGVVRIYSKKVHYLWQDCHQAMVQMQMAFLQQPTTNNNNADGSKPGIDMEQGKETAAGKRRRRTKSSGAEDDVQEEEVFASLPPTTAMQGFGIPFDLNDDTVDNAEDWVPAELDGTGEGDDGEEYNTQDAAAALGLVAGSQSDSQQSASQSQSQQQPRQRRTLARAAADLTLHSIDDSSTSDLLEGRGSVLTQEWTAFDPDDGEEQEDKQKKEKENKHGETPPSPQQQQQDEDDVPLPNDEEEDVPMPPPEDEDVPMAPPEEDEDVPMPPPADEEDVPMPPPDNDEEQPAADQSSLQAEAPRANESVASEPADGRPSALIDQTSAAKKADADAGDGEFSVSRDVSGIAILEDVDGPGEAGRPSALTLDQSSIASAKQQDESSAAAVSLGGGDSPDENETKKKRKSSTAGQKRKRKRRKIRPNDGAIELSGAEIRRNLNDTSGIVNRPAPLGQEPEEEPLPPEMRGLVVSDMSEMLMDFLSYEQLFQRPGLADDGQAAPELLELWAHCAQLRDEVRQQAAAATTAAQQQQQEPQEEEEEQPLPPEFEPGESDTDDETSSKKKQQKEDDDETVDPQEEQDKKAKPADDEAEVARQQQEDEHSDTPLPPPNNDDDDVPLPQEEEEDQPMPPPEMDEDAPPLPEDELDEKDTSKTSPRKSSLSLGLVNALGEDMNWDGEEEEEDARQEAGDDLVSSNSKWHKHTIKVYSLLKSRMAPAGASGDNDDDDDDNTEAKEPHLYYNALSEGCSRRTAVGVFFELLQLKTWDFIEVDQDESFGDITIAPGPKFSEPVPSK